MTYGEIGGLQAEALAATGGEKPVEEQYQNDSVETKLRLARHDNDVVYVVTPRHGSVESDDVEMRGVMKRRANVESRLAAAGARLTEPLAGLGDRDR